MMQKANEQFQAGAWPEAEQAYRSVIETDPHNAEAIFMLAQVRQKQGDLDEPKALLEQVAQLEPFNPNIFHAQGVLHINRRELEDAERFFHQALEINPEHGASRNGLAFIELATGRFEAAEHSATLALHEQPEDPQAMTYLGTALLELGKVKEATAYLQEALRIEPAFVTAQAQLGRAFMASGQSAFAMQCFENALQHNPDASDILEYLGRAQLDAGHAQDALDNLRRSAQGGRANPELYLALATCEVGAGNPVQAEALMHAALQMAPDREDILLPYAEMLLARGDTATVIKHLAACVEAGTDNDAVYSLLASALIEAGETERARELIEPRARRSDAPLDSVLAYVRVLEAEGETQRSEAVLETLLAQENPPLKARLVKAHKLFGQGDPKAIEVLEGLVSEPGLDHARRIRLRRMLGDALHRAERYTEAEAQYAAAAHRNAEILTIDHGLFEEDAELPETAMEASATSAWPNTPPDDGLAEPVFIIGWPGSGQETLLPALAAHPELAVILDQGPSQAARRALIDRPRGRASLDGLTESDIGKARAGYWQALTDLGFVAGDRLAIDAMWLTVESLPTIYRLFPEATVIFARRDPKDMAVFWLQAGYQHLDIMTQAYSAQLRLLQQAMDTVPLNYLTVDHDELLADPGQGFEKLLEGLGVSGAEAVVEAYRAVEMPVVAKSGDWRHYADPALAEGAEGDSPTVH